MLLCLMDGGTEDGTSQDTNGESTNVGKVVKTRHCKEDRVKASTLQVITPLRIYSRKPIANPMTVKTIDMVNLIFTRYS